MLVGHFAVGFAGKRIDSRPSLGTWILAAMLADFLWPIFSVAGLERVEFTDGRGAGQFFNAVNIALSHSLVTDVVWATLFVVVYRRMGGARGVGALLFAAVMSHWLLDFVSHRPDMPLAPGTPWRFGLGLWTSIPLTILVEGGFWALAIAAYVRATRASSRAAAVVFWVGVVLCTLVWYSNITGPAPPGDPRLVPIASFVLFGLVVLWAYWIDRRRTWMAPRADTAKEALS